MASRSMQSSSRPVRAGVLCVALLSALLGSISCALSAFTSPSWGRRQDMGTRESRSLTVERSSGAAALHNPVKTVSDTVSDFYRIYPGPPVLPMYRDFIVDLLKQTHLSMQDHRFTYDAVFALGLQEYFMRLMASYDQIVGSKQSEAIWEAFLQATGLDPAKLRADAESASQKAQTSSPAGVAEAFENVGVGLHSTPVSIGLFKIMELGGMEVNKAAVEETAKSLSMPAERAMGDWETYSQNKVRMQQAVELIREIEIRQKKKLASRLEEKARALAVKAEARSSTKVSEDATA